MTADQRLDRLERIAKLFVAAGIRARRDTRWLDEKIGILVDAQIANEERFAALADSQGRTDRKLDALQLANEKRFAALADSQRRTDRRPDALQLANEKRFAALADSLTRADRKPDAL